MRARISRRLAGAAMVMYAGLSVVLCRHHDDPIGLAWVAIVIGIGACMAVLSLFIAQSDAPK